MCRRGRKRLTLLRYFVLQSEADGLLLNGLVRRRKEGRRGSFSR